mgnify:CR=1 FL=1
MVGMCGLGQQDAFRKELSSPTGSESDNLPMIYLGSSCD